MCDEVDNVVVHEIKRPLYLVVEDDLYVLVCPCGLHVAELQPRMAASDVKLREKRKLEMVKNTLQDS